MQKHHTMLTFVAEISPGIVFGNPIVSSCAQLTSISALTHSNMWTIFCYQFTAANIILNLTLSPITFLSHTKDRKHNYYNDKRKSYAKAR